ncbi:MAG TPA: TAXI family TRAP transporter solute-binding subunit [Hyphomicrobiaceae bacterium]|nr:TAXI family TRAP transporter solute-binding subunit [Hyphomicrobiaceae bacterium]
MRFCVWLLLLICLFFRADAALAQKATKSAKPEASAKGPTADQLLLGQSKNDANLGTVTLMTQRLLAGPLMTAALDLSTLLDEGERFEKMRVLPVIARGKMQNLWDMLYLGGIDLAFLQTDTLEFLKTDPQYASIKDRVRYITVMFSEEICIVARPEIRSLTDLAGKKVSINAKGTAAAVSIPVIFARLGIKADLQYADTNIALERMKSGEFAAHTFLLAKPARAVAELKGDGLHILPIPFSNELADLYLPSKFTNADYPNLIGAGQDVETVAVGNILAVFNWPEGGERYKKVARFTEAFFGRFAELQKPGFHPKWKDVNLAAQVPGWTRFKPAQEWLDRAAAQQRAVDADLRTSFGSYLKRRGSSDLGAASESELFQQFLEWRRSKN